MSGSSKCSQDGSNVQNIGCFGMKVGAPRLPTLSRPSTAGTAPTPDGNMWQNYRIARQWVYPWHQRCHIKCTNHESTKQSLTQWHTQAWEGVWLKHGMSRSPQRQRWIHVINTLMADITDYLRSHLRQTSLKGCNSKVGFSMEIFHKAVEAACSTNLWTASSCYRRQQQVRATEADFLMWLPLPSLSCGVNAVSASCSLWQTPQRWVW